MAATYALFPGIPNNSGLDLIADELLLRIAGSKLSTFTREAQETFPAEVDPAFRASEAFIRAIRTGDRSLIQSSVPDGLRSLAVTLAANRSAETGAPTEVDPMFEIWCPGTTKYTKYTKNQ